MTIDKHTSSSDDWPQGTIVYQIYPRSFQDSNGDGIGDLPGIEQRLPYLKELGVGTIWLSPFYPSPMADFGYDVADYCDVDPIFGTLDDFKTMMSTAHDLGIRVLVDLVPNHTSDEHEWFKASRQSKTGQYSDWYIWKDQHQDSPDGHHLPPNNWRDVFSGTSAWEWDEVRQQFYLHSFHKKQPDLNWANREVHEAIKSVMRFWLDLGVDGFRVDAVYWMGKDTLYRDDAVNIDYIEGEDDPFEALKHDKSRARPQTFAYLAQMADVLKEPAYSDKPRFMITEAYPERQNPIGDYLTFYASMDPAVAAPFNFEGISLPWEAHAWHRFLKPFHQHLDEFGEHPIASYAFANHDQPRLINRIGKDAARSAAVLLLTLPGMSFIYFGEEIGMTDGDIPADKVQDPAAVAPAVGRDPARTPMQWDASAPNAGFSVATDTWLPVNDNYTAISVSSESNKSDSMLSLYKALCRLRNEQESINHGHISVLDTPHEGILAYVRNLDGKTPFLTILNFSDQEVELTIAQPIKEFVVSSVPGSKLKAAKPGEAVGVSGHEGVVFSLSQWSDSATL